MVPVPTSAAPVQDERSLALARAAADALVGLLPSTVPLEVAPYDPATGPAADATAVRASFVGGTSADLLVVADDAVAEAVAGAPGPITVADALRPALEAAAATLGPGVLDAGRTEALSGGLDDPEVHSFALVAAGAPVAWFGLRVRPARSSVPHQRGAAVTGNRTAMRLLHDVEMTLTAEIGRTRLPVRQVLDLVPGTVLELDRAAGSPADVMVNGRLVARGEVVVVDEDYGIRITEIVSDEKG